jgi:hypothetical protein
MSSDNMLLVVKHSEVMKNSYLVSRCIVTIRNHAYQKLFPFVVTRPSSLLPLPPSRICDQHVVKLHTLKPFLVNNRYVAKLHFSEPSHIVRYDVKLHLPGLGPDARYSAKLQPRTSRSPRQYR